MAAIDPEARAYLSWMQSLGLPPLAEQGAEEARRLNRMRVPMLAGEPEPVEWVEDTCVPGPRGPIDCRIYAPVRGQAVPALLYLHGGGWVVGDIDSHDSVCRALARRAGCVVLSVDYRLAPEHPFPAGPDDSWAALAWVADHGAELGGDPTRLAVGGDSAGGNLAAVVAVRARDAGAPALAHQLLVYPATDLTLSHDSIDENGRGYLLTKRAMTWFTDLYLGADGNAKDPMASPLFTDDLSGLPPATVLTAGYDPLRDEGEAYATALEAAGVPVTTYRAPGMFHGFFNMDAVLDGSKLAQQAAFDAMRSALHGTS
jgi:acetyl esterase/lipase